MASHNLGQHEECGAYTQQSCLIFQAASDMDSLSKFHLELWRHLPYGVLPHDPVIEML